MEAAVITAVGIDVSKSKSTVAVRRPGGEIALRPFEVHHTNSDLKKLASTLKKLGGDIRIVMEHTSTYWRPIALTLKEAGFFVSVVNAMLIHDFSDNTIRKLKTDRADALKIANLLTSVNRLDKKINKKLLPDSVEHPATLISRQYSLSAENHRNGSSEIINRHLEMAGNAEIQ